MTDSAAENASSQFRAYLQRDWVAWLEQLPETATAVGHPGLNDRWNDDSPAGVADRRHHLAQSLEQLDRFDRDSLDPDARLDFDLYRELLVSTEEGLAFGNDPFPFRFGSPHNLWMPLTQMDGIQTSAADMGDLQPLQTVRDYEDLLARFAAYPEAIDRNLELLAVGVAHGYTPPRGPLVGLPEQIDRQLVADPMESAILKPFTDFPSSVPAAERDRLTRRAVEVYRDRIVPALTKLRRYLEATYLPNCRETIAAEALPHGHEYYAYLVRWQTTTDLTPRQVHDLGLAEVRRIRGEMEALIRATGFSGTFAEFSEFLRTDPKFYFGTADELVDAYRVIAKKIDPALSRLFGTLPRRPYGVLPVPAFRAPTSPSAYYMPGAPSTGRPGIFYANSYLVDARPKWEMEALTLHEAVPGHHLQISIAQERDGLPAYRRETGYTAFVEGWGLYAESLGEELGFYRDPYSKFGQLTYDMWRSIRLVVDTGMHALGWSRDRAIQFFRENTGKSDQDIAVEVDRYIVWPAQALAYKIGQLKFRELRTLAERRLGERFDVRAFHDLVLEQGALPFGELTQRVERWIAARASD
jgi:uncharacterized protein (DUF885 family)